MHWVTWLCLIHLSNLIERYRHCVEASELQSRGSEMSQVYLLIVVIRVYTMSQVYKLS